MKELINDLRHLVPEMLDGLVAMNAGLALLGDEKARIEREADRQRRVSGVEPEDGGMIGTRY